MRSIAVYHRVIAKLGFLRMIWAISEKNEYRFSPVIGANPGWALWFLMSKQERRRVCWLLSISVRYSKTQSKSVSNIC